jgi:hypothetical protein
VLGTLVAAAAEPGGEGFGTHLLSAGIQEHDQGGGSSLAPGDRFEQRFLATKGLRLAVGKDRAAPKIGLREGVVAVLGAGAGSDVGEGEAHGEQNSVPRRDRSGTEKFPPVLPKLGQEMPFLEDRTSSILNLIFQSKRQHWALIYNISIFNNLYEFIRSSENGSSHALQLGSPQVVQSPARRLDGFLGIRSETRQFLAGWAQIQPYSFR